MAEKSKYSKKDITNLSPIEHVRLRPGMYFGNTGEYGLLQIFYELFSNAIDGSIKEEKPEITVCSIYPEIVIEDNGHGFPFDKMDDSEKPVMHQYLTTPHNKRSRDNHAPHVHVSYLYGVGLWGINAVAEALIITSWKGGKEWCVVGSKGKIIKEANVINEGEGKGSRVSFKADPEIFNEIRLYESKIRGYLFQTAHLFPGLKINFQGECFCSVNGLTDFIHILYPVDKFSYRGFSKEPFTFNEMVNNFHLNISLFGLSDNKQKTNWLSWTNGYETPYNGSHVRGIKKALKKVDWIPLAGMVHIIHYNPIFSGPTKGKLDLPEVEKQITKILLPRLKEYVDRNRK